MARIWGEMAKWREHEKARQKAEDQRREKKREKKGSRGRNSRNPSWANGATGTLFPPSRLRFGGRPLVQAVAGPRWGPNREWLDLARNRKWSPAHESSPLASTSVTRQGKGFGSSTVVVTHCMMRSLGVCVARPCVPCHLSHECTLALLLLDPDDTRSPIRALAPGSSYCSSLGQFTP